MPSIRAKSILCLVAIAATIFSSGCRRPSEQRDDTSDGETVEAAGRNVTVYFTRADVETSEIRLVGVKRELTPGEEPLPSAIHALLAGPTPTEDGERIHSALPEGTRLLGAEVEEGVARLNFSREIESGGGSSSMRARLAQILYTATEFEGINGVVLMVEGERVESLGGEGVIVESPMRRSEQPPVF